MNTGCFGCCLAKWDADGCTCKITGLHVGNAVEGCKYYKMKTVLTRTDDMKTYQILYKLLDGERLNFSDKIYIANLREKIQRALESLKKDNFELQAGIIGKMCIIERYISLFSDMLFEGGDDK